jgi:hypothetical protein
MKPWETFMVLVIIVAMIAILAMPIYFNRLERDRANLAIEEFSSIAIGLSDDRVVDFFKARDVGVPAGSSMKTPEGLVPIRTNCIGFGGAGKYRYVIEFSEQRVVSGLYFIGEVPKEN